MYLVGFPLLVIPFAFYNIVEFLMPGSTPGQFWAYNVIQITLASGAPWSLNAGDLMIAASLLLLYVEILKAARLSSRTIIDHLLSTLLFVAMLVEFLLVKQAATGTFFLLMMLAFIDVVAGFSITIRAAQRDVSIEGVASTRKRIKTRGAARVATFQCRPSLRRPDQRADARASADVVRRSRSGARQRPPTYAATGQQTACPGSGERSPQQP
jgi:hypothetical protein